MLQRTLTVSEAAQYFRVRPRTVREWIAHGRLAARKIGKAYIISEDEIARMLPSVVAPTEKVSTTSITQAVRFRELFRGGRLDKDAVRAERQADLDFEDSRADGCSQ